MRRRLLVKLSTGGVSRVFDDWYDLADYVKQENLAGRVVTILWWEYV